MSEATRSPDGTNGRGVRIIGWTRWLTVWAALSLSRLKIDDCDVHRVEARNVNQNTDYRLREEQRLRYGAQNGSILESPSARPMSRYGPKSYQF
jgi:hypothetical protein